MTTEPATPLHDWTSHATQMIEFWAVYKKTRSELRGHAEKMSKKATGLRKASPATRLHTPAANRQRSTLYIRR